MIYHWAHLHLIPRPASPLNLWEVSSTGVKKKKKKLPVFTQKKPLSGSTDAVSFPVLLAWFSSHNHNTALLVTVCEHLKYSPLIFWNGIQQGSHSVVFVSNSFTWNWPGKTVSCLFKWSPECKNMPHALSPRSPILSVVSTHFRLSFRWGDYFLICTVLGSMNTKMIFFACGFSLWLCYSQFHCIGNITTAASAALIDPPYPEWFDLLSNSVPGWVAMHGCKHSSWKGQSSQIWLDSSFQCV